MKLEYNYRIGNGGIEFSLIDGFDDEIQVEGSDEDRMTESVASKRISAAPSTRRPTGRKKSAN